MKRERPQSPPPSELIDAYGWAQSRDVTGLTTMILYEVSLEVDSSLSSAVEAHMRRHHIPAILRTGCFRRIRFQRSSSDRFRTSYEAETAADLERYLRDHAPAFRAEFLAEFPGGVRVSRETWHELERWG